VFVEAEVAEESILAVSALGVKTYELDGMIMYLAGLEE